MFLILHFILGVSKHVPYITICYGIISKLNVKEKDVRMWIGLIRVEVGACAVIL
jgi:hypothetical protein